ncbi:MAG: FAD binding domain-containing protein [Actinomycetota bacterium]
MKPAPFHLVRATSYDDIWSAFADADGDAKVIAGGQSLVALLNLRLATPGTVVDVSGIDELSVMSVSSTEVRIGSMVAQRTVECDADIIRVLPVLSRAVSHIGHPQIRSRGTVGGNIAHADPSSELPALMVLMDATLHIFGPSGRRTVSAKDFFLGPYTTSLSDDEILAYIVIGREAIDRRYGFHEIARCRGAFAMTGAVGSVSKGTSTPEVVLFGVASVPVRIDLESLDLMGSWPGEGFDRGLLEHFVEALTPNDDFQATADQRRSYAVVCTKKVLHELLS